MPAPVVIEEYDPEWPNWFEALRHALAAKLGAHVIGIEHVGSTSVAGLPAKPILDIDIVIESRMQLPVVIAHLEKLGYTHQGDLGIPGREAFRDEDSNVPRIDHSGRKWPEHHLYVCAKDCPELIRNLQFRDLLRANPERASAYGDLKRELAERFTIDRDGYSKAKTEFIERAIAEAVKP